MRLRQPRSRVSFPESRLPPRASRSMVVPSQDAAHPSASWRGACHIGHETFETEAEHPGIGALAWVAVLMVQRDGMRHVLQTIVAPYVGRDAGAPFSGLFATGSSRCNRGFWRAASLCCHFNPVCYHRRPPRRSGSVPASFALPAPWSPGTHPAFPSRCPCGSAPIT